MASIDSLETFEIDMPKLWSAQLIFSSPHSGTLYPNDLMVMSQVPLSVLRQFEDCFVDEIFMGCTRYGAPLLRSKIARAYIDLNREPFELDPKLFYNPLPGLACKTSPRVHAGLGTIPRLLSDRKPIYAYPWALEDGLRRIIDYYWPYHRALVRMINSARQQSDGAVLLIDCHSMPSGATVGREMPDIVLGDRYGVSCSPALISYLEEAFKEEGLKVGYNRPYAGGFITQRYGTPRFGCHAVQIELNRRLYLHESSFEKKSPDFRQLCDLIEKTMQRLLSDWSQLSKDQRAAAE